MTSVRWVALLDEVDAPAHPDVIAVCYQSSESHTADGFLRLPEYPPRVSFLPFA